MSSVPGVARPLGAEFKVIGLVGVAHLMSHFFALAVPPVFYLLKEDFGVSYAAMGFAMSMFFVGSGLLQTPAGFLVDRLGGKAVLATGLAVESFGIMLVGLAPSYALLAVALGIAGLGNSVFHPADMSILNAKVDKRRLGYAFSVHSVSGNLGWVLAPLFSVGLATAFGWRTAMFAAGAIGLAIALLLATQPLLRVDDLSGALFCHQLPTSVAIASGVVPTPSGPVTIVDRRPRRRRSWSCCSREKAAWSMVGGATGAGGTGGAGTSGVSRRIRLFTPANPR